MHGGEVVPMLSERERVLDQFAREAWKELKAIGEENVFCYRWLEAQAKLLGLEER